MSRIEDLSAANVAVLLGSKCVSGFMRSHRTAHRAFLSFMRPVASRLYRYVIVSGMGLDLDLGGVKERGIQSMARIWSILASSLSCATDQRWASGYWRARRWLGGVVVCGVMCCGTVWRFGVTFVVWNANGVVAVGSVVVAYG